MGRGRAGGSRGELAELVSDVAARLRAGEPEERVHGAAEHLASATEALHTVSRLGALMPTVVRWHLRTAVGEEGAARGCFAGAAAS